jgi:hypothetical protein
MSTASPRAGHATAPKAPARPASGRRIKATGPTPPGDAGNLRLLLNDLRDVAASNAPLAPPGSLMAEGLRVLDGARTTIAAMADAPAELATVAPRAVSRRHRHLALSTLEAFEHLSEAQAAVAHLSVHLEGTGAGMDWDGMRATLTDLVAALHLAGSSLAETSSRLTGRQDGSSAHASHVRTLTELLAATAPPELGTAYRDELLAKAASAFQADD